RGVGRGINLNLMAKNVDGDNPEIFGDWLRLWLGSPRRTIFILREVRGTERGKLPYYCRSKFCFPGRISREQLCFPEHSSSCSCSSSSSRKRIQPWDGENDREMTGGRRSRPNEADAPGSFDPTALRERPRRRER